jgi:hypothetical protein
MYGAINRSVASLQQNYDGAAVSLRVDHEFPPAFVERQTRQTRGNDRSRTDWNFLDNFFSGFQTHALFRRGAIIRFTGRYVIWKASIHSRILTSRDRNVRYCELTL